ncbi:MAG: GNAT family N-acetyltransferase [Lachnospiraceae bacterium]|nr:GNAT family N-acetyltransferase [Lachnospiraceae bacterium]
MQITMNNHNDKAYEKLFGEHIQDIFCFSFTPWFERKLWDEYYESYSVIENDKMIANICIFKTDMRVQGKPFYALQFGGVSVRKEERGRGLSRLLMEHILAKYQNVPMFLGANSSVTEFYQRFGFRPVQTYYPKIQAVIDNSKCDTIKLNPDDHKIKQAIQNRTMHSNILDSLNTQSIQMFHLLLDFSDAIYYLPGHDTIVVAEQKEDKLLIADVIARKPISFGILQKELPFKAVQCVEFGFCPDWLGVTPQWEPIDMAQEPYFILGEWDLPEQFRFPIMAET